MPIKRVQLVFKTHLDVGFTGLAAEVVDRYVERFFPAAVATSAALRERGEAEQLVWTTGSWILDHALETSGSAQRKSLEKAIEAGDLVWHALPFTLHSELCDAELIRSGLAISKRLDQRFGRTTIAAKMTDVPGHTIGLVPLLVEAGVEFLHIGVNPVAALVDVAPAFRWQHPDGAELTVVYGRGYGALCQLPGSEVALELAHSGDNLGPPDIDAVGRAFAAARTAAPGAEVVASSLDEFARATRSSADLLPVVRVELGDSWIHGAASDPQKLARYRELLRLRRDWLEAGLVESDDVRLRGFHENLLLLAEHTWGMDEKIFLTDRKSWSGEAFEALRASPAGQLFESSWAEQRGYIDSAVDEIDSGALRKLANQALRTLSSTIGPWDCGDELEFENPVQIGDWTLSFDGTTGALRSLISPAGIELAEPTEGFAQFAIQTFDAQDFERYWRSYVDAEPVDQNWARADNTKPGLELSGAVSGLLKPTSAALYAAKSWSRHSLVVPNGVCLQLRFEQNWPVLIAESIWMYFGQSGADGALTIELRWWNKPANRLPEASWLSFTPAGPFASTLALDKLGTAVDADSVMSSGGANLSAIEKGISWRGPSGTIELESLDAALVAPGRGRLLSFDVDDPASRHQAAWFCLHNNVWGTNFPMWNEGNAVFRWKLSSAGARLG